MRRPFLWIGLSFAFGIFISRTFLIAPTLPFNLLLALIPLVPICRKRVLFISILLFGFFLLGGVTEGTDRLLPQNHIAHFEISGRVTLTGKIVSLPEETRNGRRKMVSFVLNLGDVYFERKVRTVSGKVLVFVFNPERVPEYGDEIRLWGELKIPEGKTNPGQFDYRRYLENEKVYRVFQAFGPRSLRILRKGRHSILKTVFSIRQAIMKRLEEHFSFPESEVLAALLIGIQKKIPEGIRNDFVRTGTTHSFATASRGRDYDPFTGSFA